MRVALTGLVVIQVTQQSLRRCRGCAAAQLFTLAGLKPASEPPISMQAFPLSPEPEFPAAA
jgi:hypothetical protein